jgi:hypothetical protein
MYRSRFFWFSCILAVLSLATFLTTISHAWQAAGSASRPTPAAASARTGAKPSEIKPVDFNVAPVTNVADPYPTWNGVTVDAVNNVVVFSDLNRHGLFIYDRMAQSKGDDVTPPLKHITGNKTGMGFVAGVQVDPSKRVAYIAENDGWGLRTFSYDQDGNVAPKNLLATPHQVWGIALNTARHEMLVGVEELHTVMVWKQDAAELDKPLRVIRGTHTGIADPHGLYMDDKHNEIIVANHGNWSTFHPNTDHDIPPPTIPISPGHFEEPSISFYPILADGDAKPSRAIQGANTTLDWPMQIDVDLIHNEIAVADFGRDSIAIFDRAAQGNVAPIRVIKGEHTGIAGPVGVAIDTVHDEIWVANYGDHTAVVFPRTASGDVAPLRIIRNAPKTAETCGFTNASSATYDSKRKEVLVAN